MGVKQHGPHTGSTRCASLTNNLALLLPKTVGLPEDFPIRVPGVILPHLDKLAVYELV